MDLHTSNLFRLVRAAADHYQRLDGGHIPRPWREAGAPFPVIKVDYVAGGVEVPAEDDDTPVRPLAVRLFLKLNNALAPLKDKAPVWSSPSEGRSGVEHAFGRYLPKPDVPWPDAGVGLTELWARQGIGAQHLCAVKDGGQAGEAYVSDFEFMAKYRVRAGLAPYGGALYLDKDGKAVRIRLRGEDIRPGTPRWEEAAFAYRSSSLVWTTLNDHVFRTHYVLMNSLLLATKRYLHLANPLRHFLVPFHYRTAAINNGGTLTLVPKGGMFHRTTGFEWEQILQVYNDCVGTYRFETFPDELRRKGVHPDTVGADHAVIYPYGSDGLEYWNHVSAFVDEAFKQSAGLSALMKTHGDEVKTWWESVSKGLPGGLPALDEHTLRAFLSTIIFTVSGFHEHVGNVSQYVMNPALCAGKLWPGQTITDQQGSMQLCVVACITGLPMPKLMEDFGHLMPDDGARAALKGFYEAMQKHQAEVDARNARRAQPFISFSPRKMSCSVSI